MDAKKKIVKFQLALVCLVAILVFLAVLSAPDGKLHLIFCDVGQGDGILVITPTGNQILIDGGPNNRILSCLGKKMPFWDREIEAIVLTHPQNDHLTGLIEVLKRFEVKKVVESGVVNSTPEYQLWSSLVSKETGGPVKVKRGDRIKTDDSVEILVEWPNSNFLLENLSDLNESSLIFRMNFGKFCALLTADATSRVFEKLFSLGVNKCSLLKVPHHGSSGSLYPLFWKALNPKIAVISVGKNNRYGHPTKEVINFLDREGVKVFRTDRNGTVEITTDGQRIYY